MTRIVLVGALLLLGLAGSVCGQMPRDEALDLPRVWQDAGPRARLAALRVAEIDARRRLVERIFGRQLTGKAKVENLQSVKGAVTSAVTARLKGAVRLDPPTYTATGIVYVTCGVKVVGKDRRAQLVAATGNGALPGTPGAARILAKRAAEVDAARKMAERLAGLKLGTRTTVKDLLLHHDVIRTGVNTWIRGLQPTDVVYRSDGSCAVTVRLRTQEVPQALKRLLAVAEVDAATAERLLQADLPTVEQTYSVTGFGVAPERTVEPNKP